MLASALVGEPYPVEMAGIARSSWGEVLRSARIAPEGRRLLGPRGPIAGRVEFAVTPLARLRGWLRRERVADDQALVIHPCKQVHTFGMRFAIDAVFCDRDMSVIRVVTLEPGRLSPLVRRAEVCVELREGRAEACGVEPGVRLEVAGP